MSAPFSQVERFRHLRDVPGSYTGQGGKGVRVKPDESGLEFGEGTGDGGAGGVWINYPHRPYPTSGDPTVGAKVGIHSDGEHNAFPGLALTGTDLVAVWRAAPGHAVFTGADRGLIYAARSADLGRTWGVPNVVVDDGPDDARDPTLTALADGRVILSYMTNDGSGTVRTWVRISDDGGHTFGARTAANSGLSFEAVTAPVVELDAGALLLPIYGGQTLRVVFSTDGGATFGTPVTVASTGGNWTEPYVQLLDDGTLLMLIRENTDFDIYRSVSTDGGTTWTAPAILFAGQGRPSFVQLSSGAIVCLYRRAISPQADQYTLGRTSRDGGATWDEPFTFDDDHRMAYTQPVEVSGGQVAVVYSQENWGADTSSVFFRYLIDGEGITAVGDDTLTSEQEPPDQEVTAGQVRDAGRWEAVVSGAPPVAVTAQDETDWLYGWTTDKDTT